MGGCLGIDDKYVDKKEVERERVEKELLKILSERIYDYVDNSLESIYY
jgi:hypothetical protein